MKQDWSQLRKEQAFYLAYSGKPEPKRRAIPLICFIFFAAMIGVWYYG